jgi:hypothetical protein
VIDPNFVAPPPRVRFSQCIDALNIVNRFIQEHHDVRLADDLFSLKTKIQELIHSSRFLLQAKRLKVFFLCCQGVCIDGRR